MANHVTKAQREEIDAQAADLLAQALPPQTVARRLMEQTGISQGRATAAVGRMVLHRNRPGAPAGNTNAARQDGQPRTKLNVRVEQATLDWLQGQADREAEGNIGRWLDALAYKRT